MREPEFVLRLPNPMNYQNVGMSGMCPSCEFAGAFKTLNHSAYGGGSTVTFLMACLHCTRWVLVDAKVFERTILAVYPAIDRKFPYDEFNLVPEELRTALAETYAALKTGSFTLAGLGCRVVLERLVQGKGYRDRSPLEARLEKLRAEFPDLVGPLASADIIRLVGNAAAHDAYRVITKAEAEAAIEFTEDVLRAVFISPVKQKRMLAAFEEKAATLPREDSKP